MSDADRGQVAASAAEIYETFFVPALFGQWPARVLDAANARTGLDVLDIGCGTGVLARAARERVGPEGSVVGIDPNPGMLAIARRRDDIEWTEGVAESLPFEDGSFDRVVSQFAVMFFVDRGTAVAEMRRVLRRDGRVAVAAWASLDDAPGYAAMVDLLDRLFGTKAADALRAPFVLGDPAGVRKLLETVFEDVTVEKVGGVARFESVDAWVHTDIRGWTLADAIDDAQYTELLQAARADLRSFTLGDGSVSFPAPAIIASGRPRLTT